MSPKLRARKKTKISPIAGTRKASGVTKSLGSSGWSWLSSGGVACSADKIWPLRKTIALADFTGFDWTTFQSVRSRSHNRNAPRRDNAGLSESSHRIIPLIHRPSESLEAHGSVASIFAEPGVGDRSP